VDSRYSESVTDRHLSLPIIVLQVYANFAPHVRAVGGAGCGLSSITRMYSS